MHRFLGFLSTMILLLAMVNHAHADTGREDAERLRARVVLEADEIDSRTVEVGTLVMVVYGQGKRQPVSGEWAKLDTVKGYIKAVDQRRLIVGLEPDGWSKWIALEHIQTMILVGEMATGRTDNGGVIGNSQKEHIQPQDNSGYIDGGFQAALDTISVKKDNRGGTTRRVSGKLLRGVVGGYTFLWVGTLIGAGIDGYDGKCSGGFPTNGQHDSGDGKLCIGVGAFIGASTGWVLGTPIGVSMLEPNDRFIHTLGGSLGGLVTSGLLTIMSAGTLWPSMVVAPVIFSTLASEWSRHAELSRNPLEASEGRRFFIGLVPDPRGNLTTVVTLWF